MNLPLSEYFEWIEWLRGGLDPVGDDGPGLLPDVRRGRPMQDWPAVPALMAELHEKLLGGGYLVDTPDGPRPLDDLLLFVAHDPLGEVDGTHGRELPIIGLFADGEGHHLAWRASLRPTGDISVAPADAREVRGGVERCFLRDSADDPLRRRDHHHRPAAVRQRAGPRRSGRLRAWQDVEPTNAADPRCRWRAHRADEHGAPLWLARHDS